MATRQKNQNRIPSAISGDILDDLLFTVIRRTKEYSIKTVRDYVENNHKDVSQRITEISAEVSKVYKACKEGQATLDDFRSILEIYHSNCAEAISLYRSKIEWVK